MEIDLKFWYCFFESDSKDDNLDINKYMGYYWLKVGYVLGESVFSLDGCYNWNIGYGGVEMGWSYLIIKYVCFYI